METFHPKGDQSPAENHIITETLKQRSLNHRIITHK